MPAVKIKNKFLIILIVLAIIYVAQNLALPVDNSSLEKYNLSESEARLIRASILMPVLCIWAFAYYGYSRFKHYVDTIDGSKESGALHKISDGLLLLALWLPVSGVVGNIESYIRTENQEMAPAAAIVSNYIALGLVLAAFFFLYQGSKKLTHINKQTKQWYGSKWIIPLFTMLSITFVYLTFSNPVRQFPSEKVERAAYYLPDPLIALTIVLPFIMIFYFGFQAVNYIHSYRKNVRGILYAKALDHIANGIGVIVLSLIVLRYLGSLTTNLNDAALKSILGILFALILLIAVGYGFVAFGAKKLKKIEEV
jgi:hypothetical protein